MKLEIDTDARTLSIDGEKGSRTLPLYSDAAFEEISELWKVVGWNQRYTYTFTWLGRPIIQMPEDLLRVQEVIWMQRPDVIIETGVAHGGSLVFYASLLDLAGSGKVIGVDVEIRPHNQRAIETHPLKSRIDLIEGDSVSAETLAKIRSAMQGERCMVILDSNHSKTHVLRELEAYRDFVTVGSYLVVQDGVMVDLEDVPNGKPGWSTDNPLAAVETFLQANDDFALDPPHWVFNESTLTKPITYWPSAWLKRVR
ncbi:MAG: cephalosporin hydroxylase family protein [Proteobacteria bacterium]|nr:cephalosporin hydroxylase family protein [Pseudomonadota bacterium]